MNIFVEIAPGELVDKMTILEIKLDKILDKAKLVNVRHEYDLLREVYADEVVETAALRGLRGDLKRVNAEIWAIEDNIRDCERQGNFGPDFVAIARSLYRTNDRRAAIKREINLLLNSMIVEEKSYANY